MAMHTPTRQRAPVIPVPRSRAVSGSLAFSFVIPFVALLVLAALNVPLGQGYFFFRYSHLRAERTIRALPMIIIAGAFCASIAALAGPRLPVRRFGLLLFSISMLASGAWTWWAPPQFTTQQMFTMTSFSTDGAFYVEASCIESLPKYLHEFPSRLRLSPNDLGGTRVLSNPPGATMLAYGVREWFDSSPDHPGWLDRQIMAGGNVPPAEASEIANPLRFGMALMVMWILSGLAAYGLGRVFLSPAGAGLFAIIVTFNPCTVHFSPGKDPAQLLTINLMLWAWFAGWKSIRWGPIFSLIAGALLVVGSVIGLIHIWVAAIALAATLWQDRRRVMPLALRMLGALIGAFLVCMIAQLAVGWNIPRTLLAVSRRWSELQGTFAMNRSIWYLIGLPIFLLFLCPGIWLLLGLAIRRPRLNRGTRLAIATCAIMAVIYIGFGVTYELPRLWVAFLPTLVLGLAIDWPLLGGSAERASKHRRLPMLLMVVVLTQVAYTTFHWTFLDARETEYRLLSHRFYH